MIPAVGQACLAVEVRSDDADAIALALTIDHPESHAAADAERAFLARLGAGCTMPVGAYARVAGTVLSVDAMLATGDPSHIQRASEHGAVSDATKIGSHLAESLVVLAGAEIAAG
jgi:hydroxymethylbilane synthase